LSARHGHFLTHVHFLKVKDLKKKLFLKKQSWAAGLALEMPIDKKVVINYQ
jgi:hypothetical protein